MNEILTWEAIELTSTNDWDPYDPMTLILSKVKTNTVQDEALLMSQVCAFSTKVMNNNLNGHLLEARFICRATAENE